MNIFTLNIRPVWIAAMALLVPLTSIVFLWLASAGQLKYLSEKELIAGYKNLEPQAARPLYYLNYLPASATFYSHGRAAKLTGATADLPSRGFWLAVHKTSGDATLWRCSLQFQPRTGLFDLYLCHEKGLSL